MENESFCQESFLTFMPFIISYLYEVSAIEFEDFCSKQGKIREGNVAVFDCDFREQ